MGAETPEQKTRAALLGLTQQVLGIVTRGGEPPQPATRSSAIAGRVLTGAAVCFDDGRPLRRRSIFPGYQMGREGEPAFIDNEPFVTRAIEQFSEMARVLPVRVLRGTNTEADDLVSALIAHSPGTDVRIASTDRDFLQLVDERVSVYAPVKRLVIDLANFADATSPAGQQRPASLLPARALP